MDLAAYEAELQFLVALHRQWCLRVLGSYLRGGLAGLAHSFRSRLWEQAYSIGLHWSGLAKVCTCMLDSKNNQCCYWGRI